jgi:thioredoxin 1
MNRDLIEVRPSRRRPVIESTPKSGFYHRKDNPMRKLLLATILVALFLSGCEDEKPKKKAPAAKKPAPKKVEPVEERRIVLDFHATWCGPCIANGPKIDAIERSGIKVDRIDIDERPDLKRKYGITAVPTYIIVVDGNEVYRTHDADDLREHLKFKLTQPKESIKHRMRF